MKIFTAIIVSCILWVFAGSTAFSDTLREARVSLDAGRYDLAIAQGTMLGTADGLVLAAEALNAQLFLGLAERKTKTAKKAMKLAEAALVLDPNTKDAHLQYAIAYGFYGRHVSSFTAWRKNVPKKIRDAIGEAALSAPNDLRIEALKGAWHLNLLYKASGFDVEKRYGANQALGIAHFETALASNPNDIIIGSTYIMLTYVLEPQSRAAQTEDWLKTKVLSASPKNATEQQIQAQMQLIYESFATGEALARAEAFVNQ